ncbi:MAG: RNA polymerase sigma factor [Fimbriimonadaceae bacterium]|nr:MAG: RNA polymerase sigma factor [Fimbriimonadaceae bacterium]
MTNQFSLRHTQVLDRAAILEVYRAESFRLALRITGNPTVAEDVVQIAFLRLLQAPELPIVLPELIKYVRRTVTNCSIDFLNRQRPQVELSESLPNTENPVLDFEVRQALSQLSVEHQAILALAHGEGYSYREIAETLDIPIGTVGSRLNHARAEFKKIWEAGE